MSVDWKVASITKTLPLSVEEAQLRYSLNNYYISRNRKKKIINWMNLFYAMGITFVVNGYICFSQSQKTDLDKQTRSKSKLSQVTCGYFSDGWYPFLKLCFRTGKIEVILENFQNLCSMFFKTFVLNKILYTKTFFNDLKWTDWQTVTRSTLHGDAPSVRLLQLQR